MLVFWWIYGQCSAAVQPLDICKMWDDLKSARNGEQHEFRRDELDEKIAFYNYHISKGDILEEEHKILFYSFKCIEEFLDEIGSADPSSALLLLKDQDMQPRSSICSSSTLKFCALDFVDPS